MQRLSGIRRISPRLLFAAAAALLLCGPAHSAAQQADAAGQLASAPSLAPSDFLLGSGDQITLRVQDMEEMADRTVRIDPDGDVDLPLVGRVRASGLTVKEFRTQLAVKLSKYITDPQITVNLVESQSRSVSIIGEVNAPGVHQLSGQRTLIEVISLAGGIKADAGSQVIVTREVQRGPLPLPGAVKDASGRFTTAAVSLDDLLAAKTPGSNIQIVPEDVISVPKGDIVYVVGDVRRAGGFPLNSHPTISLLQALSLAEGFAPDAAASRAKILRPVPGSTAKPQEIPVDVKSIFAGKSPDVPLFANDILFIPNSAAKSSSRRAIDAIVQVATGAAIYAR